LVFHLPQPQTGENMAIYRVQLKGKNRGIRSNHRHAATCLDIAEKKGGVSSPLPSALNLLSTGQLASSFGEDEIGFAGALGKPD
jgi:3-polyprenyl-4-hydroxybenzoate decarboxylase